MSFKMFFTPPAGGWHAGCLWPVARAALAIAALAIAALLVPLAAAGAPESATGKANEDFPAFRLYFSTSMFRHLNENDAKAALKAYSQALLHDRGVTVSSEPQLLDGAPALADALRQQTTEVACVLTSEFLALDPKLQPDHLVLSVVKGSFTEQYVILVRRDKNLREVRDLKGKHLIEFSHARTALAPAWLEKLLTDNAVTERPEVFLGRQDLTNKLSRAVLPVFFGQADACLVTQRGFATMVELNPQLGKTLMAVATSPEMVPAVGFIRADYEADKSQKVMELLLTVTRYPAGVQMMNLFECDTLQEVPIACLDSARDLLVKTGHLPAAAGQARVATPSGPVTEVKPGQ